MKKNCFVFISAIMSMSFILTGCGGMAMKPHIPANIKKMAIPTFINSTLKYGIQSDLTDAVIKEFLMDGRLEITDKEKADAILEGTISKYLLEPIVYDVNNVITRYRLKIVVDLKFIDVKSNKVLWTQAEVGGITGGRAEFSVGVTGFDNNTEFEAQKEAYGKIARDIVNRVIYGWENQ